MTLKEFQRALELIKVIYESEFGRAGGDLHLVLDDNNCESHCLQYCWDYINNPNHKVWSPIVNAENELLVLLSRLNYAERLAVTNAINWWQSEFDPYELTEEDFNPISLTNTWIK